MLKTIGLAEAKAKFSEVVDRVVAGQTVIILRNGAPVVEMRAVAPVPASETVERIRALRRRIAARGTGTTRHARLRDLAHEGHRR